MFNLNQNIPDAPDFFFEKYLTEYNVYCENPPMISSFSPIETWINDDALSVLTDNPWIYDHIHFLVRNFSGSISYSELSAAPAYYGSFFMIMSPEYSTGYLYSLEHNILHQFRESGIGIQGPFWIDRTAPTGSISLASGLMRIDSSPVFAEISGQDNASGVEKIRITGDIVGFGDWIDYVGTLEIPLLPFLGRHFVSVEFRDFAGNESQIYTDDIFFGGIKYYFYLASPTNNGMTLGNLEPMTLGDNIFSEEQVGKLIEEIPGGELQDY